MGTQKLKCLKAISQKVFLNHPNIYIIIIWPFSWPKKLDFRTQKSSLTPFLVSSYFASHQYFSKYRTVLRLRQIVSEKIRSKRRCGGNPFQCVNMSEKKRIRVPSIDLYAIMHADRVRHHYIPKYMIHDQTWKYATSIKLLCAFSTWAKL